MKKRFILMVGVGFVLILTLVLWYLIPGKPSKDEVQSIGVVEAREVNLSSKLSEKLLEVKYEEGDSIKKGDIAIVLEPEKIKAAYDQAQANVQVKQANFLNSRADVQRAKVKVEESSRDLRRMSALLAKKLVAQNDKDKAQTSFDLCAADLNKAKAQEELAAASIKEAQAGLAVAKSNLNDTVIVSSLSGVVTLKAFYPGEMVPSGVTILTVVDINDAWVRLDVDETVIAKIKLGDAARIKVDALPDEEFRGKVREINSEGEFATQNDVRRGRQDIKTFRVKIQIEDTKGLLKPGMTAMSVINMKR